MAPSRFTPIALNSEKRIFSGTKTGIRISGISKWPVQSINAATDPPFSASIKRSFTRRIALCSAMRTSRPVCRELTINISEPCGASISISSSLMPSRMPCISTSQSWASIRYTSCVLGSAGLCPIVTIVIFFRICLLPAAWQNVCTKHNVHHLDKSAPESNSCMLRKLPRSGYGKHSPKAG